MAGRFTKDYFNGYRAITVPQKNGRGTRRILEYIGEWYGIGCTREEYIRLKTKIVCFALAILAVYLPCSLSGASISMYRWVAAPAILSLVPMLFLFIGVVSFLCADEKWELRVYHAGYTRIYRSAIGSSVLLGITAISCLLSFALIDQSVKALDLVYLAGMLIDLACAVMLVVTIKAHPAIVVQTPTIV